MPTRLQILIHYSTKKPPIIYETPVVPDDKDIEGFNLPQKEQKFRRWKYPNDKEFDVLTAPEQDKVLDFVLEKRTNGHWFWNNGERVWITGIHWYYLTFWKMDVGLPNYRVSDRQFFYYWDLCVKDDLCYGMCDMENRRGGKTERANVIQYEYISKTPDSRGGTQSKTDTDAKKVFAKLVRAWKKQPAWIKPIDEGDSQPKTALRFYEPSVRNTKRQKKSYGVALDSYIDYETALEEAYDGDKLKRYTMDEAGKTAKAKVNERWDIVKECLVQGSTIVGKALVTTTVEEMEKKGGKYFKEIWDKSDLDDRDENGHTKSGLYPYFKPAWFCYEGFIDVYGNSIHDTPKEPVMGIDGKWITIGSIEYLERKRRGKDGQSLASEKRKYPFVEEDAFGIIKGAIWEDDVKIILEYALEESKNVDIRYVKMADIGNSIIVSDCKKSEYDEAIKIYEPPKPHTKYSLGIDSATTDDETGSEGGSKIGAVLTKGFGEGDLCFGPAMAYSERALNKQSCYQKIYLMAKYAIDCGAEIEIIGEINGAGADCFHYLCNKGLKKYMTGTPKEYANESEGEKSGKYWIYIGPDVLYFLHGLANRFLRMHGSGFKMPSVIKSLLNYGLSNEDEASAFIVSLLNFRGFDRPVKKKVVSEKVIWENKLKPDGTFERVKRKLAEPELGPTAM